LGNCNIATRLIIFIQEIIPCPSGRGKTEPMPWLRKAASELFELLIGTGKSVREVLLDEQGPEIRSA
jgi:hypothetical protein